jgi:hypothetical protein
MGDKAVTLEDPRIKRILAGIGTSYSKSAPALTST